MSAILGLPGRVADLEQRLAALEDAPAPGGSQLAPNVLTVDALGNIIATLSGVVSGTVQTSAGFPRVEMASATNDLRVYDAAGNVIAQLGGQAVPVQWSVGVGDAYTVPSDSAWHTWSGTQRSDLTLIQGRKYVMLGGGSAGLGGAGSDDIWMRCAFGTSLSVGVAGQEARNSMENNPTTFGEASWACAAAWTATATNIGGSVASLNVVSNAIAGQGGGFMHQFSAWFVLLTL